MNIDFAKDYSLPNLFYFLPKDIIKIRNEIKKTANILAKSGFQECHLPFLIPKSLINTYKDYIRINDFIKAYSGKNRDSYAYLRPNGIFSQGVTLAGKMIKSYRDLPLKLFELSPAYEKVKIKTSDGKKSIFKSPEQTFSIQGATFSENNCNIEKLDNLITDILRKNSITFTKKKSKCKKAKIIEYLSNGGKRNISLGKIYLFNQGICRNNNIYFFDRKGIMTFPHMTTFSISQSIIFLSK